MMYTYAYFKKTLPEWKRKKDPILSQLFYRPISLYLACWLANRGVMANDVSYISIFVAILASVFFLINEPIMHLLAAVLINIWLVLDCVDGNMARTIKKQPFGDFADATSSYVLVALVCVSMSYAVYCSGGVFVEKGSSIIILIGAFASISDTLMRLIYQKYKSSERTLVDSGVIESEVDKRLDERQVKSIQVRIEAELGIGGILPFAILLASIFNALDIVVYYCFCYYGLSCVFILFSYIKKAIVRTNEIELRMK